MTQQATGTQLSGTLTLLSPLHLSAGRRVEPLEYFHDGESLRRIDIRQFRKGLEHEHVQAFDAWYAERQAALEAARDNRAKDEIRRETVLARFLDRHDLSKSDMAAALANATLYRVNDRRPDRQVLPHQHAPDGRTTIPAELLLAALRAGIVYGVWLRHGAALREALWNGVEGSNLRGVHAIRADAKRRCERLERRDQPAAQISRAKERAMHDAARECAAELESLVLSCGRRVMKGDQETVEHGVAGYDLLQCLTISDATPRTADGVALMPHALVDPVDKSSDRPRGGVRPDRWTFMECVPAQTSFRLTLEVDARGLIEAEETKFVWLDLDERFSRAFGGYRHGPSRREVEKTLLRSLLEGLNRLAEATMEGDLAWDEAVENSGEEIYGFRNLYQTFTAGDNCLRLGRDCGLSTERFGEMLVFNDPAPLPALAVATGLLDPAAMAAAPEPLPPITQDLPTVDGGHQPPGWARLVLDPEPADVACFSPPMVRTPPARPERPAAPPRRPERPAGPRPPRREDGPRRERDGERPSRPPRPGGPPPAPRPPQRKGKPDTPFVLPEAPAKPPAGQGGFAQGDKVKAKVVKAEGSVFTLDLGECQVDFRGYLPWSVGDEVKVKIVKAGADGKSVKQVSPA